MDLSDSYFNPNAVSDPPTPTEGTAAAVPTLDQELANVYSSLGSIWGNLRSKSITALANANQQIDTARKDLTPLVTKARTGLEKLQEATKLEYERLSEIQVSNPDGVIIGADGTPIISPSTPYVPAEKSPVKEDKGKGVDPSENHSPTEQQPLSPAIGTATAFFTKLGSQISASPNILELQKNLNTLQHSVASNLNTLPQSFQTNFHQIQGQLKGLDLLESTKTAELYLEKGEHWFSEMSSEIAKLAKEAVKIVPPPAGVEQKKRAALKKATGRKDVHIHRLREDYAAMLVDPAQPPSDASSVDHREAFSKFLQSIEDSGGLEGEVFEKRMAEELALSSDEGDKSLAGNVAAATAEAKLSKEAFWSRYFFQVSLIEQEESRRKQVLEDASLYDDTFSWDMEDEDDAPALPSTPSTPSTLLPVDDTSTVDTPKASRVQPPSTVQAQISPGSANDADEEWGEPSNESSPVIDSSDTSPVAARVAPAPQAKESVTQTISEAPTSPRASSDGMSSYDVVSAKSGNPSEHEAEQEEKPASDADDSDWE